MKDKIQFNLEEFKKFLEDFDDYETDRGCSKSKWERRDSRYLINNKGSIVEHITFRNYDGSTDDEYEIILEGEIID